jgi:hypothetical protein
MQKKFQFIKTLLVLFLCNNTAFLFCQTKSNLEIFYTLIDSSTENLIQNIPAGEKKIKIILNTGNEYSVFNNRVSESINNNGINVVKSSYTNPNLPAEQVGPPTPKGASEQPQIPEVNYTLEGTKTNYGEYFQNRLFGDFYTQREITLSGNYLLFLPVMSVHHFSYTFRDTINVDEIKNVENVSFPFTQGKQPAEPFFSSVYEPIIGIGAAALTVILFFTVRSK